MICPPSPRLPPPLLRLPLSLLPLDRPEEDEDEPLLLPLERELLPLSLDGRLGRTVSREPLLLPRLLSRLVLLPRRLLLPLSSLRGTIRAPPMRSITRRGTSLPLDVPSLLRGSAGGGASSVRTRLRQESPRGARRVVPSSGGGGVVDAGGGVTWGGGSAGRFPRSRQFPRRVEPSSPSRSR
ncbi:MAG TPA: hypothetical protein VFO89_05715, partial [Thermoanaerobaculia bacterium]|nr:hypothetical protein [Thermoanaerobaculia bacterium]